MADNQKRPIGVCAGCGRKRPIIDVKNQWCDACRKKVARHPGEEPLAVLGARGRPDPHLARRGKLFKIDATMKKLIAALADIGVSEEPILSIRRIVEPFLAPIAVPPGSARPAPEPKPKKQTSKAEAEQAPSEPQTPKESPLVFPAPVAATPVKKRHGRVPSGKSDPKSVWYKARKLWAQQNYLRRKKGLEPLPKPAILLGEPRKQEKPQARNQGA
jgi:hypothetical protein